MTQDKKAEFPDPGSHIPPALRHILSAADGYMDLGMLSQAESELDLVPPQQRDLPDYISLRYRLFTARKDWESAFTAAAALEAKLPNHPTPLIMRAFVERRRTSLEVARDILWQALDRFPNVPILLYNLACYECQLGHGADALSLLARAFNLDAKLKQTAVNDEDLKPLWPKLGRTDE